jgi:hypothetical protein
LIPDRSQGKGFSVSVSYPMCCDTRDSATPRIWIGLLQESCVAPRSQGYTQDLCGLILSFEYCRDGFDLNELIRVAENGDSHEGARCVVLAEGPTDDRPSVDEVALL